MNPSHLLTSNFTTIDWTIVAVYLLGTVAIGVAVNRYVHTMSDYIVAGRSLKSFIAIATLVGTELGLVTVMYAGQKGFTGGFAAFHIGLVAGIVTLIVGLTGFIVVPLRQLEVMTIPEYYERRYGRGVRIFGGVLLAFAGILNMGMFLKAGAIFVTALTGMTNPLAVNIVMSVLIVLVLFYTILGGMISVVITDYVQFVVLSFGLLIASGLAVFKIEWSNIVSIVWQVHGDSGFNPFHGQGFGPSYVIWMVFTAGLVSCAVWQTAVVRACAAESVAVVRNLYIWSSIGFMIRFLIPQFLGICALAYFWQNSATRGLFFTPAGTVIDSPELTMQAMPLFLSQILPVGLIGLIGAGMLAAFMSTHDSYLLCWASVIVEDVVNPATGLRLANSTRLKLARLFIFLIGIFLLIWSLWYPLGQDLWDYMAVSGAIYSIGAFTLLLTGLYWRRASKVGAYLALSAGLLAVLGLQPAKEAFGLTVLERYFEMEITSAQIGLAAGSLSLILMFLGSILFPDSKQPRDRHEKS